MATENKNDNSVIYYECIIIVKQKIILWVIYCDFFCDAEFYDLKTYKNQIVISDSRLIAEICRLKYSHQILNRCSPY